MFDKFKKFFAMESDEMEFDGAESIEFRTIAPDGGNYTEDPLKKPAMTSLPKTTTRKQEIVVFQPGTFNESQQAADHIKAHKTVIVNLKRTDKDLAKRIIDFLSGVNYGEDGHVQKIADNIFLFAPAHIDITMVDSSDVTPSDDSIFNRRQ